MSIREDKKQRLRSELVATALRLFLKRGYAETTLEEIADIHGIHVRTVIRYFGDKERLALAAVSDEAERFGRELEQASSEADVIVIWRRHIESWLEVGSTRKIMYWADLARGEIMRGFLSVVAAQYQQTIARAISRIAEVDPKADAYAQLLSVNLTWGARQIAIQSMRPGRYELVIPIFLEAIDYVQRTFPSRDAITNDLLALTRTKVRLPSRRKAEQLRNEVGR